MKLGFIVAFALGIVAGCGERGGGGDGTGIMPPPMGGSGVSPSAQITTLSEADRRAVCTYVINAQGGPRTHDCGDGVTFEVPTVEECVVEAAMFPTECMLTVGELEGCAEAVGPDPCTGIRSPAAEAECGPIIDCALMGMGGV